MRDATEGHTPTPWVMARMDEDGFESGHIIWMGGAEANPYRYVTIHKIEYEHGREPGDRGYDEAEANAALIVRAVNAHDALVEALEKVLDHVEDEGVERLGSAQCTLCFTYRQMLREALALARGETEPANV